MANKIIYLEPDEDITSVISRIRKSDEDGVVLSIPRGGTIGQSAVNLKLLVRNAATLEKAIGLVTNDKITQNLASRLEIKTFSKVSEAEKAHLGSAKIVHPKAGADKDDKVMVGGLNVHTYQKYSDGEDDSAEAEEEELEPLRDSEDADEEEEISPEDDQQGGQSEDKPPQDSSRDEEPHFAKGGVYPVLETGRGADAEPEEEIKPERRERQEIHQKKTSKNHIRLEGSRRIFLIISAVAIILVLVLSYLFIPFAEASLVLDTQDQAKTFEVAADRNKTEIDTANLIIPAQLVNGEKEGTKKSPSTGTKDAGEKAKGAVTLYNKLGTAIPVNTSIKIVRGDKEFIPDKSVFIPAATGSFTTDSEGRLVPVTTPGQIDVAVTAAANGDGYNLAPGNFSISGKNASDVWAENKAALSGGVTKDIKYVTAEDLQTASDSLKNELSKASESELRAQADQDGLKIADASLSSEIVSTVNSVAAEQEADEFEVTIQIKVYVIGFKESDLRQIVFDSVKSGLEDDTMLVNETKSVVNYTIASASVNDGLIKMSADFQGKVGKKIDSEKIKDGIKNISVTKAESQLSKIDGVVSSSLKTSPGFWKLTPLLPGRIKVSFDYKEDADVPSD